MATENPRAVRSIAIELSPEHNEIVKGVVTSCLLGVSDDLKKPDRLKDPERVRREADAYRRVLAALSRDELLIPDEPAREAITMILAGADDGNEYERIVAEHDAFSHLQARLSMQGEAANG